MTDEAWQSRTCPKCGSKDYQFRSRKKIVTENAQPEGTENESTAARRASMSGARGDTTEVLKKGPDER